MFTEKSNFPRWVSSRDNLAGPDSAPRWFLSTHYIVCRRSRLFPQGLRRKHQHVTSCEDAPLEQTSSAAERSRPSSSDPVNSHTFQTVALGRNFLSKQRSWSRMFLKCLPLPGGAVWSVPSKSVFTWGLHFHNHTFSPQPPVCSCCCVVSLLMRYKMTNSTQRPNHHIWLKTLLNKFRSKQEVSDELELAS